jgi:hypothetical protein
MKFQLISTWLIIESKSQVQGELLPPKLQPIILRTARHLPCFMSLFHPEGFPFSCAIVHTCIVVAKGDGQHHHTIATFRYARAVRRRENVGPTRVSTRHHCTLKVCSSRQCRHYRSTSRSINGDPPMGNELFLVFHAESPRPKKHCTDWDNTSECNLHQP